MCRKVANESEYIPGMKRYRLSFGKSSRVYSWCIALELNWSPGLTSPYTRLNADGSHLFFEVHELQGYLATGRARLWGGERPCAAEAIAQGVSGVAFVTSSLAL